ncbi:COX15/CtaA family protein [Neobacillus rhizosphaerae]|uniref:COX15/CtaA family protein n=1 Tax=Neobacillus rhizosphaerae TaxID=2880965 RepID=UPI003D2E7107
MVKTKHLALAGVVLTYFLIVFGGYVASSNSGMGCGPEWPLCNGEVIPALKGATLIEYLHRVIGATLGLLSFLLFFTLMRGRNGRRVHHVAFAMLGLLVIQVILGAVVVVRDLPSIVISVHLIIAMLFLVFLIWIWRHLELEERKNKVYLTEGNPRLVILHLNILLILLLCTMAFGAYIKHQTYGLACGWLGCRQTFYPTTIPELLQTIHRGLAVVSTLYILLLTFWSFTKGWGRSIQKRLVLCTSAVLFQLVIGAVVVMTFLDLSWAVFHLAIGTGLFALVSETIVYAGNTLMKSSKSVDQSRSWHSGRRSLEE